MSQQLREQARCGEPTSLKQTEPSLNAAASWTGLLAGPHWGGVPRAESARDSTGVVRLSAVETNRVVEGRRRIVAMLAPGKYSGRNVLEGAVRVSAGVLERILGTGKRGRGTEK